MPIQQTAAPVRTFIFPTQQEARQYLANLKPGDVFDLTQWQIMLVAAAEKEHLLNPQTAIGRSEGGTKTKPTGYRRHLTEVAERCYWSCTYCRHTGDDILGPDKKPWQLDHIHPISLGGPNAVDNLTLACEACNRAKAGKTLSQYLDEVRYAKK
jgi:hypothetical protein